MSLTLTVKPGEYVEVTPADATETVRIYNAGVSKTKLRFEAPTRVEIHLVKKGQDGS